jgi:hypothetical protein
MATIKLTQVNIGGNRYFHKFKRNSDGAIIEVATNKTAYDSLAVANPTNPSQSGYTWVSSYSTVGFDTPLGGLQDKQYATQANGAQWVKIPDYPMTKLPPGYITDDRLSQAGIDKIISMNTNE